MFEKYQNITPPSRLYHYTGQLGIMGIINSGELWATKVQYMNDSTEFERAVDIANKTLYKCIGDTLVAEPTEPLPWMLERLENITNVNTCSVSFCRDPDLLSQWRGYSGSGGGYAIGFFSSVLLEMASKHTCRLGRCIYDESIQIGIINELIEQTKRLYSGKQDMHPQALRTFVSDKFANALIECGAFFKHKAFFEEDEWRLVTGVKSYRDSAFDFRMGTSMTIPYYHLDVGGGSWRNKIADIMIGPCPHPQLSKKAVEGLLVSRHVTTEDLFQTPTPAHPPVNISEIPYRSW
jgi:hypothetical protein